MKHKQDTEKLEEVSEGFGIFMSSYDWKEAMIYAKFSFNDVDKVILALEGENDERDWKLLVKLKNGKFGWLSAGCDFSGWDCRAGGESGICDLEEEAKEKLGDLSKYKDNLPI